MVDLDKKAMEVLYTELFKKYYGSLIHFCIAEGFPNVTAEDIVAEAFTRAYEKSDKFTSLAPKQQTAWLYTAATKIMKEMKAKRTFIPFSEIPEIENIAQGKDDIAAFLTDDAFDSYIKEVYAALDSDKERELFVRIVEEKLDYDSLSKECGITSGNLRVILSRFRSKLRIIVNNILTD